MPMEEKRRKWKPGPIPSSGRSLPRYHLAKIFMVVIVISFLWQRPRRRGSFASVHLGAELPGLVDDEPEAAVEGGPVLGQHDEVGVGAVLEAALDALQAQHGRRRRRHGLQGLRDARARPVEEVGDALDERDGAVCLQKVLARC